ncbi:arsenate reductase (glutaredoxin) [Roseomonas xinghualingensis]|uniref:arsenate reductase (glutaredoxin) n=1 Tax=Roseomonas xinghualingensis TaxID=2986475 RepID=UPI0021F17E9B|nr:arsenate reductase (glutaredoxin) [Roseomonas sp. SXEYE001]MCV4207688.1 arsenate reductase (glutaredoxin) [Roseomonas sp. SXEYE001]
MARDKVTIWHNPACGTSRNVLAAIREAGIEPVVVEYKRQPPTREELAAAIAEAGITPRQAMRRKEGAALLDDFEMDDAALLDAMAADPALIERPFVFTPRGVRLCRPAETVREILPG